MTAEVRDQVAIKVGLVCCIINISVCKERFSYGWGCGGLNELPPLDLKVSTVT